MTVKLERRTQIRKRPLSLVYVELAPANGGMMRDLSEQGFSLRAMIPLRPNEKIPFTFSLDSTSRIDGEAIVLWVEDEGRVAALEFAGLSPSSRDVIRRWLENFDELTPREPIVANPTVHEASTFEELRSEIRAIAPDVERPHEQSPPPEQPQEPPPLLKLSSVRPVPLLVPPPPELRPENSLQPAALPPEAPPEREAAPLPVPESLAAPLPLPPLPLVVTPRPAPPALEPLSAFEGDTDENSPGWMDHFTLGRAVAIMLLLALVTVSFVYHREVGEALIWLGQKIAGTETLDNSQGSKLAPPVSNPAPAPNSVSPDKSVNLEPSSNPADQPKNTPISATGESTPAPKLRDSNHGSLVSAADVSRTSATPPSAEPSAEIGQAEYQRALQILRTPGREEELPEAVRLLWIAVEKGHIGAEITLAGLFREGRGVAKNCAQTGILLSAAARKGSAEAQKRLDEFQVEGCQQ